jgi:transposase-like protein
MSLPQLEIQLNWGMKKTKLAKTLFGERRSKEMRYFSEEARRAIVKEIDEGNLSKAEASRKYEVSESSIYKWMHAYSLHFRASLVKVVEHESDSKRNKKLEAELSEVYEALGRLQAKHTLLEKIVEIASSELGIDLKKKFVGRQSNSCDSESTPDVL